MQVKPTELSKDDFRNELINRFFHSDSYFTHCFSHHLQAFLNEGGNSNNNEYLLVGNLMDKLIASQNVVQELESTLALRCFEHFNERLSRGINYLYESDLEPEKMKIEIESLAQSMFRSALTAFQNEESNDKLKNLLGLNRTPAEHVDIVELREPPSEGPGLTEPEFSKEEIDVEIALVEEGGSCNSAHDDVVVIANEESQKPLSVAEAFHLAVGNQLDQLQNKIELLSSESQNRSSLQECDEIFENIISSSMIYGFDAVEEVAAKAKRFLSNAGTGSNFDGSLATSLLAETVDVLKTTLENGPDNVDNQVISKLSQNLLNPKKVIPVEEEKIVAPEPKNEKCDEPVDSMDSDPGEFTLPGEEEIFSLISEISEIHPIQEGMDIPEGSLESEPEVLIADVAQAEPGDMLSSYRKQAELYFTVIQQALNLIEGQPGHKTALEDVELACNSLYGLVMKMKLDSISKTPALLSELIRNIIGNRYSLSKNEHGLVKDLLEDFRNIASVVDVERPEFKEKIVSLHALNSKIKMSRSRLREGRSIDKFKGR